MTQTLVTVGIFVLLLALVPFGIKWVQNRASGGSMANGVNGRVISALAVGPQQRVVTVEVGPPDARTCLVLGVTQQSIACLYSFPVGGASPSGEGPSGAVARALSQCTQSGRS